MTVGRPSKGERKRILVRLPIALAERLAAVAPPDRNAWIVGAITDRLDSVDDTPDEKYEAARGRG